MSFTALSPTPSGLGSMPKSLHSVFMFPSSLATSTSIHSIFHSFHLLLITSYSLISGTVFTDPSHNFISNPPPLILVLGFLTHFTGIIILPAFPADFIWFTPGFTPAHTLQLPYLCFQPRTFPRVSDSSVSSRYPHLAVQGALQAQTVI